MDATRDGQDKRSKSDRERQIPYDITYICNLKYGTNESIYKTETDSQGRENRPVIAKKSSGGGMNWNFDVQFSSVQLLSCVRLFATP